MNCYFQQCKRLLGMCVPGVHLVTGSCFNVFARLYIFVCVCLCVSHCVFACVTAHTSWPVRQFFLDGMCRLGRGGVWLWTCPDSEPPSSVSLASRHPCANWL